MRETEPRNTVRMSGKMRLLLGVSLALNLLVIGAIGGVFLRPSGPPGGLEDRIGMVRALYGALPREDRRALRQTVRQGVDNSTLQEIRIGPALYEALRADPFDAAAVDALMTRQSAALNRGHAKLRAGWLEIVSQMSPAERLAYSDRLREIMEKRRKRSGTDRD